MTNPAPLKSPRWSSATSSSKGDSTRQTILLAAATAFGDKGYDAVSTREIARLAGVNQPAINYYFKGKEELYRACAEAIVDEFYEHTQQAADEAVRLLQFTRDPNALRGALRSVIRELSVLLILSEQHQSWSAFVAREVRNPGPAHQIIFTRLWEPGIELVAWLIAGIKGHRKVEPQSRIEAILLLSSLIGFGDGRSVTLRVMKWDRIGEAEFALIDEVVTRQIDAITG